MPPTKNKTDYRKFYYSLGVELAVGNQLQGDCPFCGRDGHFFVNPHTGQYDCKLCGASGNNWTFIRDYHTLCLSSTSPEDYEALAEERNILPSTFEYLQYSKNPLTDKWMIPTNNPEGKLTNLYQAAKRDDGGYLLLSLPSPCVQQLYRADTITKEHDTVYIAEGHWDAALWIETLATVASTTNGVKLKARPNYNHNLLSRNAVVAVPGATNFNKGWAQILKGKHVVLLHDNDPDRVLCKTCKGKPDYDPRSHFLGEPCPTCGSEETTGQVLNPGKQGIERITKILSESKHRVASLSKLAWQEGDPKDIRDLATL